MLRYNPLAAVPLVLRPADYLAEVTDIEIVKAKSSGKEYYKVTLTLLVGDQTRNGRWTMTENLTVGDSAQWRLRQFAEALGAEDEYDCGAFDPQAYQGHVLTVTTDIKTEDFRSFKDVERTVIKAFKFAENGLEEYAAASERGDHVAPDACTPD